MAFPNLYYKRTAGAAKACYICYKPTTTVLATIDTADFLYTCPVHLTDRGFATRAPEPEPEPRKPSVSPEEIARAKQEWEAKQRQKKDREQGKPEGGQADGDGRNGSDGARRDAGAETKADDKQEKRPADAPRVTASGSSAEKATSRPTHERYVLHRNIFALRTAEHRRRRQTAHAKELASRLPGAPNTGSLT